MKIEVVDLVHEYTPEVRALDGINLTIEGTEPLAIIGQNGSGKTTFVKHLNRLLEPTSGDIFINGESIKDRPAAKWAATVGYVFQNPDNQIFMDTVREEFEYGPKQVGMDEKRIAERLPEIAELVGLQDELDTAPVELSPTQKKFCAIGSVVMMDGDIVIFDEPTCGQDIYGNERLAKVIDYLHERGKLCITIAHDMKFVSRCFTRVVVMSQAHVLLSGSTEEVFSQTDVLETALVNPPPIARVSQKSGLGKTMFDVPSLVQAVKDEQGAA